MTSDGMFTRGRVVCELRDERGTLVHRSQHSNVFTDAFAAGFAPALAGAAAPFPLTLSHIALSAGGIFVERCEDVTGWTGSPVLDTATFREGLASFRRSVAASTSAAMVSPARTLDLAAATHIDLWLRVDFRGRLDAATECLRLTTSAGNHYAINWAAVEQHRGAALVDGTWARVTIPVSGFAVTGAPSWANITSITLSVAANANGALLAHWDGITGVVPVAAVATATTLPHEVSRLPLLVLENLGAGQVRARTTWNTEQAVGVCRALGLFGDSGGRLAAIIALVPPLEKSSLLTLMVEWTVTTQGG